MLQTAPLARWVDQSSGYKRRQRRCEPCDPSRRERTVSRNRQGLETNSGHIWSLKASSTPQTDTPRQGNPLKSLVLLDGRLRLILLVCRNGAAELLQRSH